jgi:DNA-binding XRE family transcriptional regulator
MKDRSGLDLLEPIAAIEARGGFVLHVKWADGLEGDADLGEHIHRFEVAAPLRDPVRFGQAAPGEGGFTADFGGDLEIPCDILRRMVLEAQGRLMPTRDFKAWKERNGLSLTRAAQALGVTRRTVAAYASGERPIPRTILLACKGWEALRDEAERAA